MVDKSYFSEIDKRLAKFNRTHPKSASQMAEIEKYKDIYKRRDLPVMKGEKEKELFDFAEQE